MARKKFTLSRFLLRPLAAFRRAHRIFKAIELHPVVHVTETGSDKVGPDGWVIYNSVAFPASTWALIKPSVIAVDYKYVGGERLFFIKQDQSIYTTGVTKDDMTAMRVAQRFENAS